MSIANREKKREREREELWKKLHELENSKMLKNASNSDLVQHPVNTSSTISNTNPSTASATYVSSTTSNTINSAASTINPSGGTGDPSSYNLIKKDTVLKEE